VGRRKTPWPVSNHRALQRLVPKRRGARWLVAKSAKISNGRIILQKIKKFKNEWQPQVQK
jgi:hypothetical protein